MTCRHVSLALLLGLAACGPKSDEQSGEKPEPAPQDYSARMAQEHRNDSPAASPAAQAAAAAPIKSHRVTYATIKGQPVQGYLAYPAQAEGGLPAVLLFHEWWGLNDNIKAMADRLAGEGYVALAADFYQGQAAAEPEAARKLMEAALADGEALSQNLKQARAFLGAEIKATRVGALGWCFGGGLALRAALTLPGEIDAAVIYYGHVGSDPAELKALQTPVLGLFGAADQGIPVESVKAFEQTLRSLGKDAEIHIYEGAGHAFANPSGHNYQAEPAQDAWARTLAFLERTLRNDPQP